MEPSPDELAGTVDGFGALTRGELVAALEDLAARSGQELDPEGLTAAIDGALDGYYLLEVGTDVIEATEGAEPEGDGVLVAGPAALPELPPGGEDLPHLLDVAPRAVDHEAVARQVEGRLRADAASAIDGGDAERAERLLDACYEVEAWGSVDLSDAKTGLAELLE